MAVIMGRITKICFIDPLTGRSVEVGTLHGTVTFEKPDEPPVVPDTLAIAAGVQAHLARCTQEETT